MEHYRLNLRLGATLAGFMCLGSTAAALTGDGFARELHSSMSGAMQLLEVAGLPPPPPPPPTAPAPVPEPTARTSSVVTALEHLGRVWESPPLDRAGVGTLAERFKTLFEGARNNDPGLAGQSVDQIVATVAGPDAVASLNAAYDKVRRAFAVKRALPDWFSTPQYQQFEEQRNTISEKYRQRARETLDTRGRELPDIGHAMDFIRDGEWSGFLSAYGQQVEARKDTYFKRLNELLDLGYRYTIRDDLLQNSTYSDQLLENGLYPIRFKVVDYGEMDKQREQFLAREQDFFDGAVHHATMKSNRALWSYHGLLDTEFRMLRVERDLEIARLEEGMRKKLEQFEALRQSQAQAAEKAHQDALAQLDTVSRRLVARFDQGTDVEYTLDSSVSAQSFNDVASGCMQSVANGGVQCGRELASDILDQVIDVKESKTGKFYQELRKMLAIPESQLSLADKTSMARSIRDLFGDKAGGFGTIADAMLDGVENIDSAVNLAKQIDAIINRDPNDPLAELKAFKIYLGLGQKFADKVPGMGKMYEQYMKSLDGIIENSKVISARTIETNRAIDWVGAVYEGRYDEPKQKKDTVEGKNILSKALNVLSNLDDRVLNGSLGEGTTLNQAGRDAVMGSTKAEREDYDKALEEHENVTAQQRKRMRIVSDALPQLEKILNRIVQDKGSSGALAKGVLAGDYQALFDEVRGAETVGIILKRAEPGYNETVAERIGDIAAYFPKDVTMKKWVKWAQGQRSLLLNLGKDGAKAVLIQAKAKKRYLDKLRKFTGLALTNREFRQQA